jgi:Type I restriction-modification system methyltransferase subunit
LGNLSRRGAAKNAIDPACGSGAFLIATFDYLMQQYEFLFLHISLQTLVCVNFYYAIQHF